MILAIGAACMIGGLIWLFRPLLNDASDGRGFGLIGTPAWLEHQIDDKPAYAINAAVYLGLFLITQWMFLLPRGSWRPKLTTEGRSMWLSAAGGAFVAMLLTIGAVATLAELGDLWTPDTKATPPLLGQMWHVMLAVWIAWTAMFAVYARHVDHHTAVSRILRGLIAGSVLETLVAFPVQAWAAQKGECYCERGSYTGMVFGITALLWVFGPGVLVLMWREKQRRDPLV